MSVSRRRIAGLVLVLLLVALGLYWGFSPQPVLVETAEVRRLPLQVTVEQEGKTRVIDRYVVAAPVAGMASRTDLDVGDPVARDQPLLEIHPLGSPGLDVRTRKEAEARLSVVEADLLRAQEAARAAAADADYEAGELERLRRLEESGAVPKDRLEQQDALARRTAAHRRSADFAVEVAKSEVEAVRTTLRFYGDEPQNSGSHETIPIRSPVAGRVLKVFRESAGAVRGGDPLIEVGDPRALEVEVDVLSKDAVRILPGMRVLFERWGGDAPLEGRVERIEPTGFTKISALGVEEQRVLAICEFTSPAEAWERLGDGYRVEARFILWEGQDILCVPTSALFRAGEGWAVFTLEPEAEEARLRAIVAGRRGGLLTEVVEGLEAGELVITHPPRELEDGGRASAKGGE